jgi:hypothetical protein
VRQCRRKPTRKSQRTAAHAHIQPFLPTEKKKIKRKNNKTRQPSEKKKYKNNPTGQQTRQRKIIKRDSRAGQKI